MRQESAFILLPGMIVVSYFYFESFFQKSLLLASLVLVASYFTTITTPAKIDYYRYQATLLINPLSYILKAKYPNQIPYEIDVKLGTFFKNDYLIKYQQDHEIGPFHKGGLNENSTVEDYKQFRWAALKIILENPLLFLENRLTLASYMLSIERKWKSIYSDEYHLNSFNRPDRFSEVMNVLAVEQENRPALKHKIAWGLYRLIYDYSQLFASYFIPIFLILGALFIKPRSRFFASLCVILLARSLLICLIAPAGYFKYLYPLWIFAPFVFCLLMGERKLRLTKAQ